MIIIDLLAANHFMHSVYISFWGFLPICLGQKAYFTRTQLHMQFVDMCLSSHSLLFIPRLLAGR